MPSRLYNLIPQGLHTPFVESITSYIVRLAVAHHIFVFVLLKELVVPLLNLKYLHQDGKPIEHRLTSKWFRTTSTQMCGVNQSTKQWIEALNNLTGRRDLGLLTLLPWTNVIPYRSLIRKNQAWCPCCYTDMERGEVYNPLLWCIREANVCLKHEIVLQTECPHCGSQLPLLSPRACIGYCSSCYYWLGYPDLYNLEIAQDEQLERTQMVGDLLAAAPTLDTIPQATVIGETLEEFIEELVDGNAAGFARYVGVNHKTMYQWRDGEQIPQLSSLIRLCEKMDITPLDLLTGTTLRQIPHMIDITPDELPHKSTPRTSYRKFDHQEIQQKLEDAVHSPNPRPMADIALELKYDHSFLIKKFPSLTSKISASYDSYIQQERKKSQLAEATRLETVMLQLHSEGQYPSHRKLKKLFGGAIRSPSLRHLRKLILKDLK